MRYALLVFLLAVPLLAAGQVYKWTDDDGTVHFSDRPHREGQEPVQISPPNLYSAPAPRAQPRRSAAPRDTAQAAYTRFEIAAPADQATVRDNLGQVQVRLAIEPSLQNGHSIRIRLDGEEQGPPTRSASFTLTEVHRGEHRLEVAIIDDNGRVLAEDSSVFYMHQASRLIN